MPSHAERSLPLKSTTASDGAAVPAPGVTMGGTGFHTSVSAGSTSVGAWATAANADMRAVAAAPIVAIRRAFMRTPVGLSQQPRDRTILARPERVDPGLYALAERRVVLIVPRTQLGGNRILPNLDTHLADPIGEQVRHRRATVRIDDRDVQDRVQRVAHGIEHERDPAGLGFEQTREGRSLFRMLRGREAGALDEVHDRDGQV